MGGTVHGLVNRRFGRNGSADNNNSRHPFEAARAFFDHLSTPSGGSIMTRVASNDGNGSAGAALTPATSLGTTYCWGLWKMNTSTARPGGGAALGEVYILLMAFMTFYPASHTPPLLVHGASDSNSYATFGIQIAFAEDGASPWNGSTNNNGNDTMGTAGGSANAVWWSATSSPIHVINPRSCNPGGSHNTNKQNLAPIGNRYYWFEVPYGFFHGISDDDNWAMFLSGQEGLQDQDDPLWYSMVAFGLYDLQPNVAASGAYACYACNDEQLPQGMNSVYGTTSGTSDNPGGILVPGDSVRGLYLSAYSPGLGSAYQPNTHSSTGAIYDEYGSAVYVAETGVAGWLGWRQEPGEDPFFRQVYNVQCEALDVVSERAAFGANSYSSAKVTVPWPVSIGEAPGATRTDAGVAF